MVVADTSPLNYLILIGEIDLLRQLYRRVSIPEAVRDELRHARAPDSVATFAANPPGWLEIVGDVDEQPVRISSNLDAGEIAAITLASRNPNTLLLMDETAGRAEAARRGIRSTGTLGILRDGAGANLVDLSSALAKLEATSFRLPSGLARDLLKQDAARKERT